MRGLIDMANHLIGSSTVIQNNGGVYHEEISKKSFYLQKSLLSPQEISSIRDEIQDLCQDIDKTKFYTSNDYNNVLRVADIHEKCLSVKKYVIQSSQINTIASKFFGVDKAPKFDKCSYELKTSGSRDRDIADPLKENVVHFHFDRSYRVFKAIVLLKDIDSVNGPFQIVKGSHLISYGSWPQRLKKYLKYFQQILGFKNCHKIAWSEEKKYFDKSDVVSLTGKAGDVFFVNTGAYHRGSFVDKDREREVIWVYCYNENFLKKILKRFSIFK